MNPKGSTVLITGGGSGIGLGLAKRFAQAGSTVLIAGRRKLVLDEAAHANPGLIPVIAEISQPQGRTQLFEKIYRDYPKLNILVNNAGIQNRPPKITEPQDWETHHLELATNLEAPMHLSMLFAPFLAHKPDAAIINVTSGLAFIPIAAMPTYCATKAALHSFTQSLREQLLPTGIQVYEVAPPAVNTDLGGVGLHTFGVNLDEYCDFAFAKLTQNDLEFGYQTSEAGRVADFLTREKIFRSINDRFK